MDGDRTRGSSEIDGPVGFGGWDLESLDPRSHTVTPSGKETTGYPSPNPNPRTG